MKVKIVYEGTSTKILCDEKFHYYNTEGRTKFLSKCRQWKECGFSPSLEIVK